MPLTQKFASLARAVSAASGGAGISPSCTKCGQPIPSEDVNVGNDVAYCRACNLSYALSDLTHGTTPDQNVDLLNPPRGAWHTANGAETIIGATHRSVGGAIGALFACLFWNGIVSVFVCLAAASTLRHLHVPLPAWFPNFNDDSMGVGMTIFLWIFLTPFIVIGLGLLGAFLSCIGGRTEVRIAHAQGVVFTGIGPFGWRKRFDPASVETVRLEYQRWRDSDGDRRSKSYILLKMREGKPLKLGTMLTEERRSFVAAALRQALRG